MGKRILLGILLIVVFQPFGQALAQCEKAKTFYHQAKTELNLNRKAQLLNESLTHCESFIAFYDLGGVFLEQGQYTKARQTLRQGLNIAGNSKAEAMALARMGQVYEAEGELQETIVCLRSSYQRYPFPKVLEKLKQIETNIADRGITAESIKKGLNSLAAKSFGVEPVINLRIHFEFNSANLNPQGRSVVEELGKVLKDPAFVNETFTLVGHTDKRGSSEYNRTLSLARAATVREYLVNQVGIDPNRIRVEGRGESELLYLNDTEQDHTLNRRVEVRLK